MNKRENSGFVFSMLCFALAGVFAFGGVNGYKVMNAKAAEQVSVTNAINTWKTSYIALGGAQEKWKRTYTQASTIPDLFALINLVNLPEYGLSANTDLLVLKKDEKMQSKGVDLGLTKVCLSTGSDSFTVEAKDYDQLLSGIGKLAQRKDIFLDNINIIGEKDVPQAKFGDLCILLRSE